MERLEAERAALMAGGFFLSLFLDFVQTAEPEAGRVKKKKNPPTSRCDVPSASTRLDPTDKNISTNVQGFFFFFSPQQIGLYLNIFLPAFIQTCAAAASLRFHLHPENGAHPSWQALVDGLL